MEHIGVASIKQAYAQTLIDEGSYTRGLSIYGKDTWEPIYEGIAFRPDMEPSSDRINQALQEASLDFASLNKEMANIGKEYREILNNLSSRISVIEKKIQAEEDRIRDINVICGNYGQFDSVIPLTDENAYGSYSYDDGVFSGKITGGSRDLQLYVIDVQGNGEEGNAGVKDAAPLRDIRSHVADKDLLTSWEYSRYTSEKRINNMGVRVNRDNELAVCSVTLKCDDSFNAIRVRTTDDLLIDDVFVSTDDGLTFFGTMQKSIRLNSKEHRYDNPDYIYESGIIAFPATKCVKIRFRACGITDEKIVDRNGAVCPGVARSRILIDGIEAFNMSHAESYIESKALIHTPVRSIAVFANEYVPPHFLNASYFEYVLTVNGIDYPVVPINSERSGIKVIRFSENIYGDDYVYHINETIKSAKLKVVIHTAGDGATPYLSHLKVCMGKAGGFV